MTNDLATRFLLGELSPEEREAVEQEFLSNNQFFEEVLAAESALMDQYLCGALTDVQRSQAKHLFDSSNHQRQTLESSRELLNLVRRADRQISADQNDFETDAPGKLPTREAVLTKVSEPVIRTQLGLRNLTWRSMRLAALSVSFVCLFLLMLALYFHSQKKAWDATKQKLEQELRTANEQLRVETQRREQIAMELEIELQKRHSTEQLVADIKPNLRNQAVSVFLAPAEIERTSAASVFTIKTGAASVRLHLELDPNWHFNHYSVLITTYEGVRISTASLDSSRIKQGKLEMVVPGSQLKPEDYRITLRGLADDGNSTHLAYYFFKVRK